MVEDYGRWEIVFRKELRPFRVVGASWLAARRGDKNRGDRVVAGIAPRVGVAVKLLDQLDVERRLLFGLSYCCPFQAFPIIDEPSGQRPTVGRMLSLDKHDPAVRHFRRTSAPYPSASGALLAD